MFLNKDGMTCMDGTRYKMKIILDSLIDSLTVDQEGKILPKYSQLSQ